MNQVTGTAAWMDVAAIQDLFGVCPEPVGLRLASCIPPDWEGFTAIRRFRRCELDCLVVGTGAAVASVELDGSPLAKNLIPAENPRNKPRARVVVRMS